MRHWIVSLAALGLVACGSESSDGNTTATDNGVQTGEEVADTAGGETVAPDTTEPGVPSCEVYCEKISAACTGANAQYKDAKACNSYCSTWAKLPAGKAEAQDGNSVGCRMYHASVAATSEALAKTHCPHAGPTGGGVCGTWCENYCALAMGNCTGDNAIYKDAAECATACGTLSDKGVVGDSTGDSLQCRIYHLGVAGSDGDTSAKTHCAHGGKDGGGVCACVPECTGKKCGDDGCAGTCGDCAAGETCTADGQCEAPTSDCGECYEGTTCGADADHAKWCSSDDCGDIDTVGKCAGTGDGVVVFCEGGKLYSIDCVANKTKCGFDDANQYYNCIQDASSQTCDGACGGQADSGCYCDVDCFQYGDCCPDACTVCTADFPDQCGACADACAGKECGTAVAGDVKCPGTCGTCEGGGICSADNKCCTPACDGKTCGDDGCGGSCGTCEAGTKCGEAGTCEACTPVCDGKVCGDDQCNGSCGDCADGTGCNDAGQCIPPTCEGKCGGPGIGGCYCDADCFKFGDCCADACTFCQTESATECTACAGACTDKQCGQGTTADYKCPGTCGTCETGSFCDDVQKCQVCSCDGKECGEDGCGNSCGTCGDGKACVEAKCIVPTCEGKCGGAGLGGCWCDADCFTNGDCCADACTFCKADNTASCDACAGACTDKQCGQGTSGDLLCPGTCGTCAEGNFCDTNQCKACSCDGKECGEDGCGKSCGTCGLGTACSADKCVPATCKGKCGAEFDPQAPCQCDAGSFGFGDSCNDICVECATDFVEECKCQPACDGKDCGDDGCGGTCGTCGIGASCSDAGKCEAICAPQCDGKECGSNGCGGTCGTCAEGKACNEAGTCEAACIKQCEGKECGADGCGGFCGECAIGTGCSDLGICEVVVPPPTCAAYCTDVMANCTGDNAQYPLMEACLAFCGSIGKLEAGKTGDTSGNTIGCRAYHAGAAKDNPAVHCAHAGAAGGGVCGTLCGNFCSLAGTICSGANAQFDTEAACETECAKFPTTGKYNATSGNTYQCRFYHLGVAGSGGDATAATHCPHVGATGGGVCVDQ